MVVPEQGHPFAQGVLRRWRPQHLAHPPGTNFGALPQKFALHRLALVIGQHAQPPWPLIGDHWRQCQQAARVAAKQALYRLLALHPGILGDLTRRRTKAGALQQMPCPRFTDRRCAGYGSPQANGEGNQPADHAHGRPPRKPPP